MYQQEKPPLIDLSKIAHVPIAMFVGKFDMLATTTDNRLLLPQLKSVVHYGEYDLGHSSFMIAKDMSYFTEDVMRVINEHNAIK